MDGAVASDGVEEMGANLVRVVHAVELSEQGRVAAVELIQQVGEIHPGSNGSVLVLVHVTRLKDERKLEPHPLQHWLQRPDDVGDVEQERVPPLAALEIAVHEFPGPAREIGWHLECRNGRKSVS